jgi:hypothetical protein
MIPDERPYRLMKWMTVSGEIHSGEFMKALDTNMNEVIETFKQLLFMIYRHQFNVGNVMVSL